MKIKSILGTAFVALCTMACSEKEDATVVDISGKYDGYTLASCSYFQNSCTANETIIILENNDGTANITYNSQIYGDFTISSAQMTEDAGVYTLKGSGQIQMKNMGGNVSSYNCTLTALIKSNKEATIKLEVPAVMGGLNIEFLTGEAPANLLLAGTYKGYSDADCNYFKDNYTNNESFKIIVNDDEEGTISLSFESATWGEFNIESIVPIKNGDEYIFEGSSKVLMGMGESKNEYDFTMSGKISSDKEDYSVVFNIPAVMGGMTLTLLPGTSPIIEVQ